MDREIEPNHELDYLAREVIRAAIAPVHLAQVLSYLKIKRLALVCSSISMSQTSRRASNA